VQERRDLAKASQGTLAKHMGAYEMTSRPVKEGIQRIVRLAKNYLLKALPKLVGSTELNHGPCDQDSALVQDKSGLLDAMR
jgi:hypothetical protein